MSAIRLLACLGGALLLLGLGAALGWKLARTPAPEPATPAPAAETKTEPKILYWYDPMMPQQHFDQPGKSPFMDMELLPKYAGEALGGGLRIDPERTQNLGMRLATARKQTLRRQWQASAMLDYNPRDQAIVQAKTAGFVSAMPPLATGDKVRAGQILVELTLPEWTAAQQQWLAVSALNDAELIRAAEQRIMLLGMPEPLLGELRRTQRAQTRFAIRAPQTGVLQSVDVRGGMAVAAGQTLFRINPIANLWLEVAVNEAQLGGLSAGDRAEIKFSAYPDQIFVATVAAILPALDQATRAGTARIELPNPKGRLHPGMSAQVTLETQAEQTTLSVPTAALIRTGKRTLVILADAAGHYQAQEVLAGPEIDDQTQITAGLEEGQTVVASGQFLIDSEANLNGIPIKPLPQGQVAEPQP